MHVNADLANKLIAWSKSGQDPHDILNDCKRKGLVALVDGALKLSPKGDEFIAKWTAGKPENTYTRKPIIDEQPRQSHSQDNDRRYQPRGYGRQGQGYGRR